MSFRTLKGVCFTAVYALRLASQDCWVLSLLVSVCVCGVMSFRRLKGVFFTAVYTLGLASQDCWVLSLLVSVV